MTDIQGPARLGKEPVLKHVGEDNKPVCELRVIFLNYRTNKQDQNKPVDSGFWAQVNIWGKFAEPASRLFNTGDKVYIMGDMDQDSFKSKDANDGDDDVTILHVNSNIIFPWTIDIESLTFTERKGLQKPSTLNNE
ncbi:MAG: single-stranded DNA-binding protein [Gammaproteobacteria bacterium]|nr:single-stranded DNA-binding protein [Gammaproteobacteria bacterium]MBT6113981.1 single-stranded DNA-binding protein [Candidatus Neomarinimicrobiota bacterium]MBT4195127.1 single-stranded DNA-binding protein [Gammaproteobacteria bacterium]MBT4449097.1 single-stranded DNA-binding protein [Gammaproteobacteria bacterium]MBT6454534.1 single-stranded DNA-binding protein [Gammaproteobacteria bacterium]